MPNANGQAAGYPVCTQGRPPPPGGKCALGRTVLANYSLTLALGNRQHSRPVWCHERRIDTTAGLEFLVASLLGDAAAVKHKDAVGAADR
jgi:hypothetical protein